MKFRPVQIFGFIMSFVYVIFGLLIMFTSLFEQLIEEDQYRKIFGGILAAYGLVRILFFLRKLLQKS